MRRALYIGRRLGLATAGLLTVGGCNLSTGPRTGEFRGIYVSVFEGGGFRMCGRRDYWAVSGGVEPIQAVMTEHDPARGAAAYVHVRGTRSAPGRYGHAGSSRYELVVSEVLEASADTVGKCR